MKDIIVIPFGHLKLREDTSLQSNTSFIFNLSRNLKIEDICAPLLNLLIDLQLQYVLLLGKKIVKIHSIENKIQETWQLQIKNYFRPQILICQISMTARLADI